MRQWLGIGLLSAQGWATAHVWVVADGLAGAPLCLSPHSVQVAVYDEAGGHAVAASAQLAAYLQEHLARTLAHARVRHAWRPECRGSPSWVLVQVAISAGAWPQLPPPGYLFEVVVQVGADAPVPEIGEVLPQLRFVAAYGALYSEAESRQPVAAFVVALAEAMLRDLIIAYWEDRLQAAFPSAVPWVGMALAGAILTLGLVLRRRQG
jgi:hypothetical protein